MKKWKKCLLGLLAAVMAFSGALTALVPAKETKAAGAETTLIDLNTVWNYLDNNTDPAGTGERTSWTLENYDDSDWSNNDGKEAKFGAKNGAIKDLGNNSIPTVLLNQYIEGTTKDIPAFFFRTSFTLDSIPENMELVGTLKYDDAVIVYLNGTKIASYYEPEGGFESNLSYGGSNDSDPKDETFTVDTDVLKTGINVLAVELHQGRESSSDIYFEMSSLKLQEKEEEQPAVLIQKAVSLTVGASASSRNLTWYANSETAGKVQYAPKAGDTFPEVYQEAAATAVPANDSGFYSNQASLSGLSSNTEYVYRLVNGETVSEVYSFKTGGTGAFSFLLAGDPQIGAGSTPSDIAGWEDTLSKAAAVFPDASFLVSAGDQVNTASDENQYAGYLEHGVLTGLTTATVIGNHDSGSNAYSQHFNNPNVTAYGSTAAGNDYWYVYNNVLFMNLNSNNMSTAEHKAFMEEAIAANKDVDWKVVVFHHSIFSVASHAYDNDILQRRSELAPVFKELDVDVVLMGHDHVYVRSYMMDGLTPEVTPTVESSVTDPDGILYVTVNSASGSKFYSIKNETFEYAAVQSQEKIPNISNVEVTENSFKITTYRTSDMSVVDSFEILRKAEEVTEPAEPGDSETDPAEPSESETDPAASGESETDSTEPSKPVETSSGQNNGQNNGSAGQNTESGKSVSAGKSVYTGDNRNIVLWISLLAAAGIAAAGIVTVTMKKRKEDQN